MTKETKFLLWQRDLMIKHQARGDPKEHIIITVLKKRTLMRRLFERALEKERRNREQNDNTRDG